MKHIRTMTKSGRRVPKPWRKYEQVAATLLSRFRDDFGLATIGVDQKLAGIATSWNLEITGTRDGDGALIIVECRRKNRALVKEELGGIAYRIQDLGAAGGIVVTTVGYQKGAEEIARHENIVRVILDRDSTTADYVMKFLHDTGMHVYVGASATVAVQGRTIIDVRSAACNSGAHPDCDSEQCTCRCHNRLPITV